MDVTESVEQQRVVEVNGVEFTVKELATPLGFLRGGDSWEGTGYKQTLQKMKRADLVERVVQRSDYDMSAEGHKWQQIDGQCSELFDQLNEPYSKWRVKIERYISPFGMWSELDFDDAEERAREKMEELERRNPDVGFRLDEEQLNNFPIP